MLLTVDKEKTYNIRYVKIIKWCLLVAGIALLFILLAGSENAEADTIVPPGPVSDAIYPLGWNNAGSPYWVQGDIFVPSDNSVPGVTNRLTIDGNTGPIEVRFNGSYSLTVGVGGSGIAADVQIWGLNKNVILSSNLAGNTWKGIEITDVGGFTFILDSVIERTSGGPDTAIWLNGCTFATIVNNEIREVSGFTQAVGIQLYNGAGVLNTDNNFVQGNYIHDVSISTGPFMASGISLTNASANTINNNVIEFVSSMGGGGGGGAAGIFLKDSSFNTIGPNNYINNIVSDGNIVAGIELFGDCDTNTIDLCDIYMVDALPGMGEAFGVRLVGDGFTGSTPDSNTIKDSTIRNINALGFMAYGISVSDAAITYIFNNSVTNSMNGIYVQYGATVNLLNNEICDNIMWGIYMDKTSSGNWAIDTKAMLANNRAKLNGSIFVTGGKLTLYNVMSSEVKGVSVAAGSMLELGASPASIISQDVWVDGVMYVNSSKLEINCTTSHGQYGIEVNGTGAMIIQDNGTGPSNITDSPWDNDGGILGTDDFRFNFKVRNGAIFNFLDSELSECGWLGGGSDIGLWVQAQNAVIKGNTIRSCYRGIYSTGGNLKIENNIIDGNDDSGIRVGGTPESYIANNTINLSGNGNYAIELQQNNHWVINNTINTKDAFCRGILLDNSDGNNIFDNTITTTGFNNYGITVLYGSDNNTVVNNTISVSSSGYYGIFVVDSNQNTLEDNTLFGGDAGIYLENSTNIIIGNNTISNSDYGIQFTLSSTATLYNNEIFDNTIWGIWMDATSSGDWYVYDFGSLINNPAKLNGSIVVTAGKLTFYNVDAEILNVSIGSSGLMELGASPTSVISNDVWVDGFLYINSSKWEINVTGVNGSLGIQVNGTGTMIIQDNGTGPSIVTDGPYDTDDMSSNDFRYYFKVLAGSTFRLLDSNVSEIGWNGATQERGLYINTLDCYINNSNFRRNYYGVETQAGGWTFENNDLDKLDAHGIWTESCSNMVIANNTLNTSISSSHGIYIRFSNNNNIIDNNTVTNFNRGIYFESSGGNDIINNNVNNNWDGIYLMGSGGNDIINNTAIENGNHGMYIWGGSNGNFVSENNATDNGFRGIGIRTSSGNTVDDNDVFLNPNMGIHVWSSNNNNIISNNTVSNNPTGIGLQDANNNIVRDNTVVNNTGYGILLTGSSTINNIINNTVMNDNNGIYLTDSGSNTIVDNRIWDNNNGIYLTSGSGGNNIMDNTIWDNGYGIRIEGSSATLFNNEIYNNTNWGLWMNPSASGDWYVDDYALLFNNDGILNGDLMVFTTGKMLIEKSSLDMEDTIIQSSGLLEVLDSKTSIISWNLTVVGTVTLDNVTWNIDNTFDGEHWINVVNTGTLNVTNDSLITANDPNFKYDFWVDGNATFTDSIIEHVGHSMSSGSLGIYFMTPNVVFDNMVVRHSFAAIWVEGVAFIITNTEIYNCTFGVGLRNSGSGMVLDHIEIHDLILGSQPWTMGIIADNLSDITISNVTIHIVPSMGFSTGINLNFSNNFTIENSNITYVQGFGIMSENSTGTMNHVYIANCTVGIQTENSTLSISDITLMNHTMVGMTISTSSLVEIIDGHIIDSSGGIRVADGSTAFINSTTIENQTLPGNTQGLYIEDGTTYINDTTLLNQSTGITAFDSSSITISNSYINDSVSTGIYCEFSVLEMRSTTIYNSSFGIYFTNSWGNNIYDSYLLNTTQFALIGVASGLTVYDTLFDYNSNTTYADNSAVMLFVNSTMANVTDWDFIITSDSHVTTLNTTFDNTTVGFGDMISTLTVQWFLHVKVEGSLAEPIPGANVDIMDNANGTYEGNFITNVAGYVNWTVITEYVQIWNDRIYYTPYDISAWNATMIGSRLGYIYESMLIVITLDMPAVTIDYIRIEYLNGALVTDGTIITADDEITVYARGYNFTQGLVGGVSANWLVNGGIGLLSGPTGTTVTFNATTVGIGNISATYNLFSNITGNITVTPGAVVDIMIIPTGPETYTADDTIVYKAEGYDSDGNLNTSWIPEWSWDTTYLGDMTELTPDGYNYSIDFNITDTSLVRVNVSGNPSVFNTSSVTVTPGKVFEIIITPGGAEMNTTDEILNLTVAGYDADGNLNTSWTPFWNWSGPELGIFTISGFDVTVNFTTVGFSAINVSDTADPSVFNDTKSVTVDVGAPYRIVYVSGSGQFGFANAELSFPFVVRVEDYDGNPVPNIEINWTIDDWPLGAIGQSLSDYNSMTNATGDASTTLTLGDLSGLYNVSASNLTLTLVGEPVLFNASVTIYTIDEIWITDGSGTPIYTMTVSADDTLTLYAWAYNETGGLLGLVAVNWSSVGGIGTFTTSTQLQTQVTFDFITVGIGNFTVEFKNATTTINNATGDIQVIPGAVANIVITPPSVTNTTDGSDVFTVEGYDADGNENWSWTPSWSWPGTALGIIDQTDPFNVTVDFNVAGSDSIHVEVQGDPAVFDEASVTVRAGVVMRIEITPWPNSTATTDDIGVFSVIGYDADDNENWSWTPAWDWEGSGLGMLTQSDLYNYTIPYDAVGSDTINVSVASDPTIYNTTDVMVDVGQVVRIEITPWPSTSALINDIGMFSVIGYDADDNENWSWAPNWSWEGAGLGTLTPITMYNYSVTFITAGSDVVNVSVLNESSVYNTSSIIVTAPVTVDYIVIMDAAGGAGNAVTDLDFSVDDKFTFYAAGFNYSSGYVTDIEVTWSSSNETNGTVSAGPNISTVFAANDTHGGTVIITATNSSLSETSNSTGTLTVLDPEVDYIQIRDAASGAGNIVTTADYSEGETDIFYTAAYNLTAGFLDDVSVDWSSADPGIGTVSPTTGTSTTFTAGTVSGTTTVTATYTPLITTVTGTLTVTVPTVTPTIDYIVIMDAPGGAGNIVTDITINGGVTGTYYAVGYNATTGDFVRDVSVTWAVTAAAGTIDVITGYSTNFTAANTTGTNVTGDLTATYNVLSNSTSIFVDLPPSTPADFTITKRAEGESLYITWTTSTEEDVDGYIIHRSQTSGSGFSAIETVVGRTNSLHTDTGLTDGTTYYYYIVAYDSGPNYSPGSVEASETSDSDTDGDNDFNLIDDDDDDDGLLDTEEDKNGNGIFDEGETDPLDSDTDGDGHNDKDDFYPLNPDKWEEDKAFPIMLLILPIIIIIILVILAMVLRKREPEEEYPPEEELEDYEEEEMEEPEEEEEEAEEDSSDEEEPEPEEGEELEEEVEDTLEKLLDEEE